MSSSAPVLQRFLGHSLRQGFRWLDRAPARQGRPFDEPGLIRPNIGNRLFNVSHYGVMIPDLPEPFRFFSLMAIIGSAGNRLIDTDHMLVDRPARNATQVSGTAAAGTDQFAAYSIDRDCDIRPDGSLIRLGQDVCLSGSYPDIRLQVTRAGFELDIALQCHDNVTWFAHTPVYKHLGLMADYQGHILYQGQRHAIAGICTYEYFTMAGPYGFIRGPLPPGRKVPMDFFTYQIVAIDSDTQLMLAKVGASGVTALEAAFVRRRGTASQTYAEATRFEVSRYEDEPRMTPDGRRMRLPQSFTWTVLDGNEVIALIHGQVDTPFIYGLASGYVGGYHYEGQFRGRSVSGRGYIEYVHVEDTAAGTK